MEALATFVASRSNGMKMNVRLAYEKIYNAWIYFPCSNIPRLGATGHLAPEQITHPVAHLIDPQSPVNKKIAGATQ